MLISKEKHDDLSDLKLVLSSAEVALRMYEKTGTPSFREIADDLKESAQSIKERIRTTDYTKRDALRARLDKILK